MYEIKLDFFKFVFTLLKFTGLNAYRDAGIIYKLIMFLNCCFVFPQFYFEMNYIITAPDGYLNAIKCLGAASFRILSIARLLHFIFWNDKYVEIWQSINRKSFNFEHFYFDILKEARLTKYIEFNHETNYVNLKDYWEKIELDNDEKDEKQMEITNIYKETIVKYKLISYGVFTFMIFGTFLSLLSSFLLVIIRPPTLIYDEELKREVALNELPYRILVPFVDLKDPYQYKMAMYYEAYAISYLSFQFLSTTFSYVVFFLNLNV